MRLATPEEVKDFQLNTIDKEISLLEKNLSDPHQRIGFCHNDLQYGNIMMEEETKSITIIVSFFVMVLSILSILFHQNVGY